MPTIPELPWKNNVDDSDPCQPVKEQGMGGVIISCKGTCQKARPNCVLQKRRIRSEHNWEDVPESTEAGDEDYEYRCICR